MILIALSINFLGITNVKEFWNENYAWMKFSQ